MSVAFFAIAIVTLAGAIAAMSLRNPVHCALCLVVAFAGLAAAYLQLGAEFVGFAQILVYIGAVAILIVFAILLTRSSEIQAGKYFSGASWIGVAICIVLFAAFARGIRSSTLLTRDTPAAKATVQQIGLQMFQGTPENQGNYLLPLELAGVLLTAAMLGAAVIALQESKSDRARNSGAEPRS